MSEHDRYIPGVPCWVDTSQPDPEAATAFYGGLFGWEFENVMPPDAPGRYFLARRTAATSPRSARSPTERRRPPPGTPTSGSRTPTRRPRRCARPAAPCCASRTTSARSGAWPCSPIRRAPSFSRLAGRRRHRGAAVVNEHGSLNFNNLHTRDVEGATAPSTARCSAGSCSASAATAHVGAAGLRRLPRGAHARACARTWPQMGAPARFEEVVASLVRIPTTSPTPRTGA